VFLTLLADIVEEVQRILEAADQNHFVLRLFGGLAVRSHRPGANHGALGRICGDIDFAKKWYELPDQNR
jgi:hypothetical protein